MRVCFLMLSAGYVRNYETTLRRLVERGHHVHVAFAVDRDKVEEKRLIEQLVGDAASTSVLPLIEPGRWADLADTCRALADYARYFAPVYAQAAGLRDRMANELPPSLVRLTRVVAAFGEPVRRLFMRAVIGIDRLLPPSPAAEAFLASQQPDVVLVTPLVEPQSVLVEYVKACERRGIPSALCVASWDNLTNKGHIRVPPTRVLVWNEHQRREAVDLHGVPADRVVVTGAQLFDQWFDRRPSRSREAFCARVGLDPGRPFVLYLGSSGFIAPAEAGFVRRWLRSLRTGATAAREFGVLVRPHPGNTHSFLGLDLSAWPNTAMWPAPDTATDFFVDEYKDDFFDSLYHCAVVVGVNTSALIEAGIVGRPVCTVLAPEFAHAHDGTIHFHLLADGPSALLHIAPDLPSHVAQIAALAQPADEDRARLRRFVGEFVRPHGLDRPAMPLVAGAIEALAAQPPAPHVPRGWWWLKPLLTPLAMASTRMWAGSAAAEEGRLATAIGGWLARRDLYRMSQPYLGTAGARRLALTRTAAVEQVPGADFAKRRFQQALIEVKVRQRADRQHIRQQVADEKAARLAAKEQAFLDKHREKVARRQEKAQAKARDKANKKLEKKLEKRKQPIP
jgi:hypothetical protein